MTLIRSTDPPPVCTSCQEPLYWLAHERTGKPAPIEIRTSPVRGNILVDLSARTYRICPPDERPLQCDWLHLNHFVTCPQAPIWHKAGRSSRP